MKELVSIDFLVVPTVRFKILYVFLVLSLECRCIVHFAVTEHPTAAWTAQQVVEAFPWDTKGKQQPHRIALVCPQNTSGMVYLRLRSNAGEQDMMSGEFKALWELLESRPCKQPLSFAFIRPRCCH